MSYIHEALKKAQEEKESLAGKCAHIWPRIRRGRSGRFHRQQWISVSAVLIAVAFSAWAWIRSIEDMPRGRPSQGAPVYRSSIASAPPLVPAKSATTVARPAPAPRARQVRPAETQSRREAMRTVPDHKPTPVQKPRPLLAKGPPAPTAEPRKPPENAPKNAAKALYRQALALQKQGKLQQAVKLYKAALQGSPELVSALNNLGVIYIKQKNPAEARRVLEMAIRKDSRFVDPYYNLACLYAQQKDIARSLFYLKKAISADNQARQWAATDEDLRNLRGNPEYERIIKEAPRS